MCVFFFSGRPPGFIGDGDVVKHGEPLFYVTARGAAEWLEWHRAYIRFVGLVRHHIPAWPLDVAGCLVGVFVCQFGTAQ